MLLAVTSQQELRQNADMRKISAWAAIIAIPTAIAGIYGMNFKDMPELRFPVGVSRGVGSDGQHLRCPVRGLQTLQMALGQLWSGPTCCSSKDHRHFAVTKRGVPAHPIRCSYDTNVGPDRAAKE